MNTESHFSQNITISICEKAHLHLAQLINEVIIVSLKYYIELQILKMTQKIIHTLSDWYNVIK